jgi:hypothetical protein
MTIARLNNGLEADRLAGQLGAHCSAQKRVLVEDVDLAQIARVVTDDHLLADGHGQRQIEIPKPLK